MLLFGLTGGLASGKSTVAANLAGLPSISVPCGFTAARLPCGLQLTGRAMDETTVLRVADAFERATPYAREKP